MSGELLSNPLGTEPSTAALVAPPDSPTPGTAFEAPGPLGSEPIPLAQGDRIITATTKDWVPPKPASKPAITVTGKTLADVVNSLNALSEWGRGGGLLRTDAVPVGTSPTVTVAIHANLIKVLPTWSGYSAASAAAKAEWDSMIAKLTIHEERHMEIAVEEANNLAAALLNVEIANIPTLVTAANKTMQTRQDQLDTTTDHGAKVGVTYGDVFLDTSIP